jgi:hypothetical protein
MKFNIDILIRLRDIYANRREPESLRAFADIYWRTVIVCAFVLVVLAIAYGTWDLSQVLSDLGQTPDTTPAPTSALSRSVLKSTVQVFDARQGQFDEFKVNPPAPVPDPSK